MLCRVMDLRDKEVVNVSDGCCMGCVSDVEIDSCCATVKCIVIYGRPRLFGLLGRDDDVIICWDQIQCIGEDTVLVNYCAPHGCCKRKLSAFDRLFG